MLIRIVFLLFSLFPAVCYSYSGDLPRDFVKFATQKMVELGECKDMQDCTDNRRVLFSQFTNGFHLSFYSVTDSKKAQTLISLLVDEYERKGVDVRLSLSFSKEKHMPNKGYLTVKQVKNPYIYFAIHEGA
ncbi:hypothetical protein [Cellvibrio sp. pealriver]|uniref:hypothetical protein n=1 Tax=Cellvibrio sp. pealriver TaxID=1622269 RepID=UPI00066FFDCA|nr:hypothetical protein [Cellvibrio sp. pealriver]